MQAFLRAVQQLPPPTAAAPPGATAEQLIALRQLDLDVLRAQQALRDGASYAAVVPPAPAVAPAAGPAIANVPAVAPLMPVAAGFPAGPDHLALVAFAKVVGDATRGVDRPNFEWVEGLNITRSPSDELRSISLAHYIVPALNCDQKEPITSGTHAYKRWKEDVIEAARFQTARQSYDRFVEAAHGLTLRNAERVVRNAFEHTFANHPTDKAGWVNFLSAGMAHAAALASQRTNAVAGGARVLAMFDQQVESGYVDLTKIFPKAISTDNNSGNKSQGRGQGRGRGRGGQHDQL